MNNEWIYFKPNKDKVFEITTFDDGNDKYTEFTNKWYVIGKWKGKVSLMNAIDSKVKIQSISSWKTILCG